MFSDQPLAHRPQHIGRNIRDPRLEAEILGSAANGQVRTIQSQFIEAASAHRRAPPSITNRKKPTAMPVANVWFFSSHVFGVATGKYGGVKSGVEMPCWLK